LNAKGGAKLLLWAPPWVALIAGEQQKVKEIRHVPGG
jgi:hypothetical protein